MHTLLRREVVVHDGTQSAFIFQSPFSRAMFKFHDVEDLKDIEEECNKM